VRDDAVDPDRAMVDALIALLGAEVVRRMAGAATDRIGGEK
jgi:hypothetical protein